jgi:hypothetical protein
MTDRTAFVNELLQRPQPASAFDALREFAFRLRDTGARTFPPVLAVGGQLDSILDEIQLAKNIKTNEKARAEAVKDGTL